MIVKDYMGTKFFLSERPTCIEILSRRSILTKIGGLTPSESIAFDYQGDLIF